MTYRMKLRIYCGLEGPYFPRDASLPVTVCMGHPTPGYLIVEYSCGAVRTVSMARIVSGTVTP